MKILKLAPKIATMAALTSLLGACSITDKLVAVGQAPVLTAIADPTSEPGYRPIVMPMPEATAVSYQPNSLFRSNSKGFFKDQRAHRVGDILTVMITISDKAQIANKTDRSRSSTNDAGVTGVLGSVFDTVIGDDLNVSADAAVGTNSGIKDNGSGSVNRSEKLETQMAAVVVQVLPNGNLVIEGHQEVRVNFERRDLVVSGIVRPEDIGADNTIDSSKIAEARISYGGKGQITDVQQPRYGAQVLDAILPF